MIRLRLLDAELGLAVCDLYTEDLCALEDLNPLAGGDTVGDLGGVGLVVHEQEVDLVGVVDEELAQPARHQVSGLLVASVTDGRHGQLALEAAADSVIDTLGLSPGLLDAMVAVRLVTLERLRALLDDGDHFGLCESNL